MRESTDEAIARLKRTTHDILAQAERGQRTMRTFLVSLSWYLFGICTGAVGMVYQYEMQPVRQPVVTVEQDGAGRKTALLRDQQSSDAAPPLAIEQQLAQYKADQDARFSRQEQRNKELVFALRKLQGVKQNWDVALGEVPR